MKNLREELTNWAHALVAWIAVLVAGAGGGATIATTFGAHIGNLPSLQGNGFAAFLIGLGSKFIDSANNAITKPKAAATAPSAPTPYPPLVVIGGQQSNPPAPPAAATPPVPAPVPPPPAPVPAAAPLVTLTPQLVPAGGLG